MSLFFEILIEFGLPVAAASTMGVFIYIILKYIFIKLNMNKIILNVVKENLPALKLYRKFLMKENKKGKYIYFSMTKNFFLSKIYKKLKRINL